MLGNAAAAVLKHVHDWAGRLVAATKSSQTPLRWLLRYAPKFRCSTGATGLVCFWRGGLQAGAR
jgi:hypothetical protein